MVGQPFDPSETFQLLNASFNAKNFPLGAIGAENGESLQVYWDTINHMFVAVNKFGIIVYEAGGGSGCYEISFNQFFLTGTGAYYPRLFLSNGLVTLGSVTPTIIRPRQMTMSASASGYIIGETIIGQTSGSIGVITDIIGGTAISYSQISDTPFLVAEIVIGQTSGQNLSIVSLNENFADMISFDKDISNAQATQIITYSFIGGSRNLFSLFQSTGSQTLSDVSVHPIVPGGTTLSVANDVPGSVANDDYALLGLVLGHQVADSFGLQGKLRFIFNN